MSNTIGKGPSQLANPQLLKAEVERLEKKETKLAAEHKEAFEVAKATRPEPSTKAGFFDADFDKTMAALDEQMRIDQTHQPTIQANQIKHELEDVQTAKSVVESMLDPWTYGTFGESTQRALTAQHANQMISKVEHLVSPDVVAAIKSAAAASRPEAEQAMARVTAWLSGKSKDMPVQTPELAPYQNMKLGKFLKSVASDIEKGKDVARGMPLITGEREFMGTGVQEMTSLKARAAARDIRERIETKPGVFGPEHGMTLLHTQWVGPLSQALSDVGRVASYLR